MKKPRLTTLDCEVALMARFNIRQNLIVPNVSWGIFSSVNGTLHECDLIVLSNGGYATEIEIKVSKADLLKDKGKKHGHSSNHIRRLYFAVPEKLKSLALEEIPDRAGLIIFQQRYVEGYTPGEWMWIVRTEIVRKCKINPGADKWDDRQRYQLARLGTMRILGLKRKIQKLKKK